MLKRYSYDRNGKKKLIAKIYTQKDHSIDVNAIDQNAVKIIRRLKSQGHEGYIVGGAVRDLIKGQKPKDFDIATSAHPKRIRRLFWNSRIIGKRFKLVHIHFNETFYEVSTFRSGESSDSPNVFGELEEDVKRRDFSINALYYNPLNQQILDFVDGMKDIRDKKIRSLIPLEVTFNEDPVRIIRGIKYSSTMGFNIEKHLKKSMKKHAPLIGGCPSSRLTEELFKILESGSAQSIFSQFLKFDIMQYFLPYCNQEIREGRIKKRLFLKEISKIDKKIQTEGSIPRGEALFHLLDLFTGSHQNDDVDMLFLDIFKMCKTILSPLTPPNVDTEDAVKRIMIKRGIHIAPNRRLSVKKSKRKALQKSAGHEYRKSGRPRRRKNPR